MLSRTLFVLFYTAVALASRFVSAIPSNHPIPAHALKLTTRELLDTKPSPLISQIIGGENQNSTLFNRQSRALLRLTKILEQAEKRKETIESNEARFLGLNRGGRFRGLLVVWLPVSFVLPTLKRQKFKGYYRSLQDERDVEPLELNDIEYDPNLEDYKFDPNYGPLLSRLDGYFGLLGIDELPCRTLLLCQASKEATTYQPLSNLFIRLMERSQAFDRPTHYHKALRRFFTYYWAVKKGRNSTADSPQCEEEYPGCPWRATEMIRMDMLHFWQGLSRRFAIQLEDE